MAAAASSRPAFPLGPYAEPKHLGVRHRCQLCVVLQRKCSVLEEEVHKLQAANGLLRTELQPLSNRLAEVEARPAGMPLRSLDPRHFAAGEPPSDSEWSLFDDLVAVTVANAKLARGGHSSREASPEGGWAGGAHRPGPHDASPARPEVTAPALAALLYGRGAAASAVAAGCVSGRLDELRLRRCDAALRDSIGARAGHVCRDKLDRLAAELDQRLDGRQRAALIHRLGGGARWRQLEQTNAALEPLNAALSRQADALRQQLVAVQQML
eukprot:scaffold2205_cov131-Isochrysis_galbana.AAC.2